MRDSEGSGKVCAREVVVEVKVEVKVEVERHAKHTPPSNSRHTLAPSWHVAPPEEKIKEAGRREHTSRSKEEGEEEGG